MKRKDQQTLSTCQIVKKIINSAFHIKNIHMFALKAIINVFPNFSEIQENGSPFKENRWCLRQLKTAEYGRK